MNEDIIGFVMGALDAHEHQRIEDLIRSDTELQSQVDLIRRSLLPLESYRHCEPPSDLHNQTLAYVFDQVDAHKVGSAVPMMQPAFTGKQLVASSRRSWRPMDIFVTGIVAASLLMLLSPALFNSRFAAELRQCQNNLQKLYAGFSNYSITHEGEFPTVPYNSAFATSGAYAPILIEQGYVEDEGNFFCPAASESIAWRRQGIPTRQIVTNTRVEDLAAMQQRMGGTYGYSVGYQAGGRIRAIHNQQRPNFALIADRPSGESAHRYSMNHGGLGQNILFENGHVAFVRGSQIAGLGDHYYVSDRGIVEPGIHRDDSVIMESGIPLTNVSQ
jgi:hypothetical protein